mmetsp:Transcript_13610/g.23164  ORF Transcript_13610/g.23164 Transcript_13610/m.23164 type:complete len:367 (+) Transcript_13610:23-1123(+)
MPPVSAISRANNSEKYGQQRYYNHAHSGGAYAAQDYEPRGWTGSQAAGAEQPKLSKHPKIEVIMDRLYWVSGAKPPTSISDAYFFTIDQELVYDPFNNDFGPLNLALTHKFVRELIRLLSDPKFKDFRIIHYCSTQYDKQANAAFLMGAFMVIVLKVPASAVWELFEPYHSQFRAFRDASYSPECSYPCTIEHCLQGLEYAIKLGWYQFKEFDNKEYEYYERVENGDLNWIIPGKFIAFMGPLDRTHNMDRRGNSPEDYIQVFKHFNVTRVIRLNEAKYDKGKFVRNGIQHSDLFFIDGSTPPQKIVDDFLKVAESEQGAMAIHCKAGLGRTGTLIGLYAMKHFKFPAAAFIGWIRIARPGSILGP